MKSFVKFFIDTLLARDTSSSPPLLNLAGSKEDVVEYPARPKGIPPISPKEMMENHKDTIRRIIEQAITDEKITAKFYLPTIERFASFVHLLPASQTHHHHDVGGLFRHSIEVGHRALQLADRVLVGGTRTPRQRRDLQPKWQYAVFAAALCHDCGKPLNDMTVSNTERTITWKPLTEDLYAWAIRNNIKGYHIDWQEGRGRQHTSLAILLLERIVTREALEWLELSGMELVTWLTESLNYNPSPTNLIHDLVVKADQFSVERNLKSIGSALVENDNFNAPTERYVIQIMKSLIKEGMWRINEPGARVWKIDEHVYVVWPLGGDEIGNHARLDNVPMVPRTADGLLEFMVEREIAIIRDGESYLWEIAPECITEKLPDKKLLAIRLRSDSLISTLPLQAVPGILLNGPKSMKKPRETGYERSVAPDAPSAKDDRNLPLPLEAIETAPIDQDASPHAQVPQRAPADDEQTARVDRHADTAIPEDGPKSSAIQFDGAAGEVLKAIAQDLGDGTKKWDEDAYVEGAHVLLRWPECLEHYGIPSATILTEMADKKWLHADPLNPLKRTVDAIVNGVQFKAVKLDARASSAFLLMKELPSTSPLEDDGMKQAEITPVVQKPFPERKPKKPSKPKPAPAPAEENLVAAEPQATEPSPPTPSQVQDHEPLLEQVIAFLRGIEGTQYDAEGWGQIPRSIVNRRCKGEAWDMDAIKRLADAHPAVLRMNKLGVHIKAEQDT